ncbi:MAG: tRNA1(Val) (adenine(37)-N6)-methyltransferase [Eubacterium sp.]|nr:tRNA1(Val) (adenine(37)-N6)-methyltransferase [Eubacterium sp.]
MKVELKEGERIDELERKDYKIIQDRNRFCFGMDAVLLSGFAEVRKGDKVLDLGTGTGIIPLLLEAKTEGNHFTGLEIQEQSADMAKRSVLLNDLQDKINIINGDIKEASDIFGGAIFDIVTCNPPYMTEHHGLKNFEEPKAIARHEIKCNLEDVIRETAKVLKPGGRFYMVHRPRRLVEIIHLMHKYKIEPKRLRMVHPFEDKDANMILIEGHRGGGVMMKVEPPLIVYQSQGVFTEEILKIYGKI